LAYEYELSAAKLTKKTMKKNGCLHSRVGNVRPNQLNAKYRWLESFT
jgi:hypothetical protein